MQAGFPEEIARSAPECAASALDARAVGMIVGANANRSANAEPKPKRGRGRPRKEEAERHELVRESAAKAERSARDRERRAKRRMAEEEAALDASFDGAGMGCVPDGAKRWDEMTDREVRDAFETLAAKAVAMMDANQFEAYDGRRERVARKLKMNRMESVPVDEAKVRRCVVALSQGARFRDAVKICGQADFMDAKEAWMPDVSVAYGLIRRRRDGFMEMLRDERMADVEEALVRAATEPGFRVDTKAAMFVAENGDRKRWGARLPDGGGMGAGGGAKVTYNNPQLTVNMIMSPRELEERKANEGVVFIGEATDGVARVVDVARSAVEAAAAEAEAKAEAEAEVVEPEVLGPKPPVKVVIPKFKVKTRIVG